MPTESRTLGFNKNEWLRGTQRLAPVPGGNYPPTLSTG